MVDPAIVIRNIATRLADYFGDLGWWPANNQLEICIGAILTQNTSWNNVELAIDNLRDYGILSISDFLSLPQEDLENLIRPSGYYRQKARKIRVFVEWFDGTYSGNFICASKTKTDILRNQLLDLWGIGPETADAMLCYAFGKPVVVVDLYLKRILGRHNLIDASASYEAVQSLAARALPSETTGLADFHAHIVETAKRWCHKRDQHCEVCPLAPLLP
jgi:endonuclease-3 related protein